ncbi:hypothetical protein AM202_01865 [Actinobacillus minor 202]|uniref:Uncharacterized protein n=1 Tax=Actinobacillus minor 202 TaxID=591023 RepID=A0ABP2GUE1_9PAST|nr:hypothetical protein AM202_01865 [Actinobacillus minor 202]
MDIFVLSQKNTKNRKQLKNMPKREKSKGRKYKK